MDIPSADMLKPALVERVAAPVRQQVEDLLREAIVTQRFSPGQRLVERELIEWLGVSRTTVREALRHLAAEGLVTTIPQRGVIVALPTKEEAEEIYEVRSVLEGLVAARFAARASEEQIRSLKTALERVETALLGSAPATLQEKLRAKDAFYGALIDGAGNQTVRTVLEQLQARISVLRATSLSAPGRNPESVAEMRQIVEAIERRDVDAASEAATAHVRQAARALFAITAADASGALVLSGAENETSLTSTKETSA